MMTALPDETVAEENQRNLGMSLRRRKRSAVLKEKATETEGENKRKAPGQLNKYNSQIYPKSHTKESVRRRVSKCSDPSKRM